MPKLTKTELWGVNVEMKAEMSAREAALTSEAHLAATYQAAERITAEQEAEVADALMRSRAEAREQAAEITALRANRDRDLRRIHDAEAARMVEQLVTQGQGGQGDAHLRAADMRALEQERRIADSQEELTRALAQLEQERARGTEASRELASAAAGELMRARHAEAMAADRTADQVHQHLAEMQHIRNVEAAAAQHAAAQHAQQLFNAQRRWTHHDDDERDGGSSRSPARSQDDERDGDDRPPPPPQPREDKVDALISALCGVVKSNQSNQRGDLAVKGLEIKDFTDMPTLRGLRVSKRLTALDAWLRDISLKVRARWPSSDIVPRSMNAASEAHKRWLASGRRGHTFVPVILSEPDEVIHQVIKLHLVRSLSEEMKAIVTPIQIRAIGQLGMTAKTTPAIVQGSQRFDIHSADGYPSPSNCGGVGLDIDEPILTTRVVDVGLAYVIYEAYCIVWRDTSEERVEMRTALYSPGKVNDPLHLEAIILAFFRTWQTAESLNIQVDASLILLALDRLVREVIDDCVICDELHLFAHEMREIRLRADSRSIRPDESKRVALIIDATVALVASYSSAMVKRVPVKARKVDPPPRPPRAPIYKKPIAPAHPTPPPPKDSKIADAFTPAGEVCRFYRGRGGCRQAALCLGIHEQKPNCCFNCGGENHAIKDCRRPVKLKAPPRVRKAGKPRDREELDADSTPANDDAPPLSIVDNWLSTFGDGNDVTKAKAVRVKRSTETSRGGISHPKGVLDSACDAVVRSAEEGDYSVSSGEAQAIDIEGVGSLAVTAIQQTGTGEIVVENETDILLPFTKIITTLQWTISQDSPSHLVLHKPDTDAICVSLQEGVPVVSPADCDRLRRELADEWRTRECKIARLSNLRVGKHGSEFAPSIRILGERRPAFDAACRLRPKLARAVAESADTCSQARTAWDDSRDVDAFVTRLIDLRNHVVADIHDSIATQPATSDLVVEESAEVIAGSPHVKWAEDVAVTVRKGVQVIPHSHLISHTPKMLGCEWCDLAKISAAPFIREAASTANIGSSLMMHVDFLGRSLATSRSGARWLLVAYDDASSRLCLVGCKTREVAPFRRAINRARAEFGYADGVSWVLHCDQEGAMKSTIMADYLTSHHGVWSSGVPNRPTTHAKAEAAVKVAVSGMRVIMLTANAHEGWWDDAAVTFAVNRNYELGYMPAIYAGRIFIFGQVGIAVLAPNVYSPPTSAPRGTRVAFLRYDLHSTSAVRVLYRDEVKRTLRTTFVCHREVRIPEGPVVFAWTSLPSERDALARTIKHVLTCKVIDDVAADDQVRDDASLDIIDQIPGLSDREEDAKILDVTYLDAEELDPVVGFGWRTDDRQGDVSPDIRGSIVTCKLTRTVTRAECRNQGQFAGLDWDSAIARERAVIYDKHKALGPPREYAEVAAANPDAEFIRSHLVRAIKHFEMGRKFWIPRVRFVGNGGVVRDASGNLKRDVLEMWMQPASVDTTRVFMVVSNVRGEEQDITDADGAYLQARKIKKLFTRTPESMHTPEELAMRDPVRSVDAALYGTREAGFEWDDHSDGLLTSNGWKQLHDIDRSVYINSSDASLLKYVDDFNLSGPPKARRVAIAQLATLFLMKDPERVDASGVAFVGVQYAVKHDGSSTKRTLIMQQTKFARVLLERYLEDCARFTIPGPRTRTTPADDDTPPTDGDKDEGVFAAPARSGCDSPIAATHIGGIMFLARCTRPDLMVAVFRLSRYFTCWTRRQDRWLSQLYGYLMGTLDLGLVSVLDVRDFKERKLEIRTYMDADHGGCHQTRRSTTGVHIVLKGPYGTSATLLSSSSRQGAAATSTGEAELIAISSAWKKSAKIEALASALLRYDIIASYHSDNTAAISAVRAGFSDKMQYIRKLHGICISVLHDQIGSNIHKVDTHVNSADVFTKPLGIEAFTRHIKELGLRVC